MATNSLSRLFAAFLLILVWAMWPQAARAADRYCANRYMPAQQTACFKTLGEAEQYIRTEPATPIGNALLEVVSSKQSGGGNFTYKYEVKRRAPNFLGDFYSADNPFGTGRGCASNGVKTPKNETRCDDEAKLSDDIKLYYQGSNITSTYYLGAYDSSPISGWTPYYQYLSVNRSPASQPTPLRTFTVDFGTLSHTWKVYRTDWYKCPDLFTSAYPNPGVVWTQACTNGAQGEIYWKSEQYDSCCKDGNPAVASTGNKEYRETDFDWEGEAFSRSYNSIADMPLQSGMTDSWAHSFSARLVMADGSPNTWIRSDGYYESPRWDAASSSYGSNNRTGVVIVKEPDDVAAVRGRWRISTSDRGLSWFNESGRLSAFDRGGRIFTLQYCSQSDVQAAVCLSEGDLRSVRSSTGRSLVFDYIAAFPPKPGDSGARVSRISADGAVLVEYVYDGQGRLTHASKGGAAAGEGMEYLYAEPNYLCKTASGGNVAGCVAGSYPNYLTGVLDENGQRYASYSYDEMGRVVISEHAGGTGKVTLTYTGSTTASVTLPNGATKNYVFSTQAFRQPTNIAFVTTDGSSAGTASSSWSNYRRDWSIAPSGARTDYQYNPFHEISRKEGLAAGGGATALTRTIQTDWSPGFANPTERRVLDSANALVAKSQWSYNGRGQVLTSTQIDPVSNEVRTSTKTYCEDADVTAGTCPLVGLIKSLDGPRTDVADVTTYTYYASDDAACAATPADCAYRKGDLWKVINPLGQVVEYLRYDSAGRALSSKDPNGVVTDLEYTPRGWLSARKVRGSDPNSETDDAITRYEYDLIGQVKKVIQPDNSYIRYEYDAAHRLTDIFDMAGNRIHYTLNAEGARTKEDTQDSNGTLKRTLSRIYNQLGQLKTAKTAEGHPTGYTYDAGGNGDVETDALGHKTDSDHDPLGRLAKTLQDVGGINAQTEFKYDTQDRLVRVTDPKNLNTDYGYNGLGDQTRLSSPDTGVSTFTYDSAGNRKTATDARGITETYSYDALNRMTSVVYPTPGLNVAYTYDSAPTVCAAGETFARGRLTLMTDGSGSTQYCYDRFGNTVRKVQTTNGKVFTVRYGYSLAGQLSSVTYPDGALVTYQRDAQGRISRVDAARGGTGSTSEILLSQVGYHPFGPVATWIYGNGRTMSRPVDQDYRTIAIHDPDLDGLSVGFGFDAVGNIDKLTSAGASNPLLAYSYDALNRLTHLRDGATSSVIEAYTYDASGNRLSFANAVDSKIYNYDSSSHRLLGVDPVGIRKYDASGNTIQIGARKFTYNDLGRNDELIDGVGSLETYVYNGRGERLRRGGGGGDRYAMYDEKGRWLGEYDSTGKAEQQIIWMDGLPVGLFGDSGGAKYVESDGLGSPRVVVDPIRNRGVWSWDVKGEAFGNSEPNEDADGDGAALRFDMRFPGQRFDRASGFSYNYLRSYDPSVGRYLESDPIGLNGGINTYSYAYGDPLGGIDPRGTQVMPPMYFWPPPPPPPGASLNGDGDNASSPLGSQSGQSLCAGGWCDDLLAKVGSVCTYLAAGAVGSALLQNSVSTQEDIIEDKALLNQRYHRACDRPPPPHLDNCEAAKWQYRQSKKCYDLRNEWEERFGPIQKHQEQLVQVKARMANAVNRIIQFCCRTCQ
ncbi:RHS repeat protein [Lysobacter sp. K5869]|uniref:RHS repeat-associated core domain-containing protein n=1 Tax=Lysobacter sp. K5869 TaxID=2820808 RepID=UPI001C0643B8|nr:RHS repeat-associated core domain-containing protein [Lysobacter sp. K5869]QWP76538.1 RHS repeat protein [Lysobacter sp. K5869]